MAAKFLLAKSPPVQFLDAGSGKPVMMLGLMITTHMSISYSSCQFDPVRATPNDELAEREQRIRGLNTWAKSREADLLC